MLVVSFVASESFKFLKCKASSLDIIVDMYYKISTVETTKEKSFIH